MKYCGAMLLQGLILLSLNIYLDYARSVSYKGKDNKLEDTERS
jgi:hypothetical protein